ncbi:MAG TPA: hypothetical protein VKB58_00365 [Terriglobales bacterium]|jgi:hypothetical protein|nr:hypothetical protein [Terriglobales bacterium]
MSQPDPEQERKRLADLYAGMSDGELESIAQDAAELTDLARESLRQERDRRQLDFPIGETGQADDITWEDLVVAKQFRDLPDALLAKGSLDSAGIESFLVDDNVVRMSWFWSNLVGEIKLCVRAEDADAAVELLSQPIPAAFEVEDGGSFQQPTCPQCHSLDISYETLNKPVAYASAWIGVPIPLPRKRWKCHACRAEWQEDPVE